MPTYEYACRDCGHHVEVVQSFRDDPLQTCESCGGRLRKVFSAAGIIFKGSGYYVTDTRAERSRAGASKPRSDGAKADSDSGDSKNGSDSGDSKNGSDSGDSKSGSDSSDSSTTAESA